VNALRIEDWKEVNALRIEDWKEVNACRIEGRKKTEYVKGRRQVGIQCMKDRGKERN
jgi:hypothetical protein